jgi:enoyl-CoA hydratase/carnithine racemase
VQEFPKPTIAMIRGYCIGGGLGSRSAAICGSAPTIAFRRARREAWAGLSAPACAGSSMWSGRPSPGKSLHGAAVRHRGARAMGLVNRVVPEAELEAYVKNYAETIAGNAPLTVKAVKYIVGEVTKDESKRNLARCAEMVDQCFASTDFIEGRRAFMEKRKPAFTGK